MGVLKVKKNTSGERREMRKTGHVEKHHTFVHANCETRKEEGSPKKEDSFASSSALTRVRVVSEELRKGADGRLDRKEETRGLGGTSPEKRVVIGQKPEKKAESEEPSKEVVRKTKEEKTLSSSPASSPVSTSSAESEEKKTLFSSLLPRDRTMGRDHSAQGRGLTRTEEQGGGGSEPGGKDTGGSQQFFFPSSQRENQALTLAISPRGEEGTEHYSNLSSYAAADHFFDLLAPFPFVWPGGGGESCVRPSSHCTQSSEGIRTSTGDSGGGGPPLGMDKKLSLCCSTSTQKEEEEEEEEERGQEEKQGGEDKSRRWERREASLIAPLHEEKHDKQKPVECLLDNLQAFPSLHSTITSSSFPHSPSAVRFPPSPPGHRQTGGGAGGKDEEKCRPDCLSESGEKTRDARDKQNDEDTTSSCSPLSAKPHVSSLQRCWAEVAGAGARRGPVRRGGKLRGAEAAAIPKIRSSPEPFSSPSVVGGEEGKIGSAATTTPASEKEVYPSEGVAGGGVTGWVRKGEGAGKHGPYVYGRSGKGGDGRREETRRLTGHEARRGKRGQEEEEKGKDGSTAANDGAAGGSDGPRPFSSSPQSPAPLYRHAKTNCQANSTSVTKRPPAAGTGGGEAALNDKGVLTPRSFSRAAKPLATPSAPYAYCYGSPGRGRKDVGSRREKRALDVPGRPICLSPPGDPAESTQGEEVVDEGERNECLKETKDEHETAFPPLKSPFVSCGTRPSSSGSSSSSSSSLPATAAAARGVGSRRGGGYVGALASTSVLKRGGGVAPAPAARTAGAGAIRRGGGGEGRDHYHPPWGGGGGGQRPVAYEQGRRVDKKATPSGGRGKGTSKLGDASRAGPETSYEAVKTTSALGASARPQLRPVGDEGSRENLSGGKTSHRHASPRDGSVHSRGKVDGKRMGEKQERPTAGGGVVEQTGSAGGGGGGRKKENEEKEGEDRTRGLSSSVSYQEKTKSDSREARGSGRKEESDEFLCVVGSSSSSSAGSVGMKNGNPKSKPGRGGALVYGQDSSKKTQKRYVLANAFQELAPETTSEEEEDDKEGNQKEEEREEEARNEGAQVFGRGDKKEVCEEAEEKKTAEEGEEEKKKREEEEEEKKKVEGEAKALKEFSEEEEEKGKKRERSKGKKGGAKRESGKKAEVEKSHGGEETEAETKENQMESDEKISESSRQEGMEKAEGFGEGWVLLVPTEVGEEKTEEGSPSRSRHRDKRRGGGRASLLASPENSSQAGSSFLYEPSSRKNSHREEGEEEPTKDRQIGKEEALCRDKDSAESESHSCLHFRFRQEHEGGRRRRDGEKEEELSTAAWSPVPPPPPRPSLAFRPHVVYVAWWPTAREHLLLDGTSSVSGGDSTISKTTSSFGAMPADQETPAHLQNEVFRRQISALQLRGVRYLVRHKTGLACLVGFSSWDHERDFLVKWGNPGGTKKDRMQWLEKISTVTLQVLSCTTPFTHPKAITSKSSPVPSLSSLASSSSSFAPSSAASSSPLGGDCGSVQGGASSKKKKSTKKTGEENSNKKEPAGPAEGGWGRSSSYFLSSSHLVNQSTEREDEGRGPENTLLKLNDVEQDDEGEDTVRTTSTVPAATSPPRVRGPSRRRSVSKGSSSSRGGGGGGGAGLGGLSHVAAQKAWKHLRLRGMESLVMASSALRTQMDALVTPQMESVEDASEGRIALAPPTVSVFLSWLPFSIWMRGPKYACSFLNEKMLRRMHVRCKTIQFLPNGGAQLGFDRPGSAKQFVKKYGGLRGSAKTERFIQNFFIESCEEEIFFHPAERATAPLSIFQLARYPDHVHQIRAHDGGRAPRRESPSKLAAETEGEDGIRERGEGGDEGEEENEEEEEERGACVSSSQADPTIPEEGGRQEEDADEDGEKKRQIFPVGQLWVEASHKKGAGGVTAETENRAGAVDARHLRRNTVDGYREEEEEAGGGGGGGLRRTREKEGDREGRGAEEEKEEGELLGVRSAPLGRECLDGLALLQQEEVDMRVAGSTGRSAGAHTAGGVADEECKSHGEELKKRRKQRRKARSRARAEGGGEGERKADTSGPKEAIVGEEEERGGLSGGTKELCEMKKRKKKKGEENFERMLANVDEEQKACTETERLIDEEEKREKEEKKKRSFAGGGGVGQRGREEAPVNKQQKEEEKSRREKSLKEGKEAERRGEDKGGQENERERQVDNPRQSPLASKEARTVRVASGSEGLGHGQESHEKTLEARRRKRRLVMLAASVSCTSFSLPFSFSAPPHSQRQADQQENQASSFPPCFQTSLSTDERREAPQEARERTTTGLHSPRTPGKEEKSSPGALRQTGTLCGESRVVSEKTDSTHAPSKVERGEPGEGGERGEFDTPHPTRSVEDRQEEEEEGGGGGGGSHRGAPVHHRLISQGTLDARARTRGSADQQVEKNFPPSLEVGEKTLHRNTRLGSRKETSVEQRLEGRTREQEIVRPSETKERGESIKRKTNEKKKENKEEKKDHDNNASVSTPPTPKPGSRVLLSKSKSSLCHSLPSALHFLSPYKKTSKPPDLSRGQTKDQTPLSTASETTPLGVESCHPVPSTTASIPSSSCRSSRPLPPPSPTPDSGPAIATAPPAMMMTMLGTDQPAPNNHPDSSRQSKLLPPGGRPTQLASSPSSSSSSSLSSKRATHVGSGAQAPAPGTRGRPPAPVIYSSSSRAPPVSLPSQPVHKTCTAFLPPVSSSSSCSYPYLTGSPLSPYFSPSYPTPPYTGGPRPAFSSPSSSCFSSATAPLSSFNPPPSPAPEARRPLQQQAGLSTGAGTSQTPPLFVSAPQPPPAAIYRHEQYFPSSGAMPTLPQEPDYQPSSLVLASLCSSSAYSSADCPSTSNSYSRSPLQSLPPPRPRPPPPAASPSTSAAPVTSDHSQPPGGGRQEPVRACFSTAVSSSSGGGGKEDKGIPGQSISSSALYPISPSSLLQHPPTTSSSSSPVVVSARVVQGVNEGSGEASQSRCWHLQSKSSVSSPAPLSFPSHRPLTARQTQEEERQPSEAASTANLSSSLTVTSPRGRGIATPRRDTSSLGPPSSPGVKRQDAKPPDSSPATTDRQSSTFPSPPVRSDRPPSKVEEAKKTLEGTSLGPSPSSPLPFFGGIYHSMAGQEKHTRVVYRSSFPLPSSRNLQGTPSEQTAPTRPTDEERQTSHPQLHTNQEVVAYHACYPERQCDNGQGGALHQRHAVINCIASEGRQGTLGVTHQMSRATTEERRLLTPRYPSPSTRLYHTGGGDVNFCTHSSISEEDVVRPVERLPHSDDKSVVKEPRVSVLAAGEGGGDMGTGQRRNIVEQAKERISAVEKSLKSLLEKNRRLEDAQPRQDEVFSRKKRESWEQQQRGKASFCSCSPSETKAKTATRADLGAGVPKEEEKEASSMSPLDIFSAKKNFGEKLKASTRVRNLFEKIKTRDTPPPSSQVLGGVEEEGKGRGGRAEQEESRKETGGRKSGENQGMVSKNVNQRQVSVSPFADTGHEGQTRSAPSCTTKDLGGGKTSHRSKTNPSSNSSSSSSSPGGSIREIFSFFGSFFGNSTEGESDPSYREATAEGKNRKGTSADNKEQDNLKANTPQPGGAGGCSSRPQVPKLPSDVDTVSLQQANRQFSMIGSPIIKSTSPSLQPHLPRFSSESTMDASAKASYSRDCSTRTTAATVTGEGRAGKETPAELYVDRDFFFDSFMAGSIQMQKEEALMEETQKRRQQSAVLAEAKEREGRKEVKTGRSNFREKEKDLENKGKGGAKRGGRG